MKNMPIFDLSDKDQVWGQFLNFLIRTQFEQARASKKQFVESMVRNKFTARYARDVWRKGLISKYINIRHFD